MRILLDHCLPRRLKRLLATHDVATAAEQGWERLQNGKLLAAAAAAGFEALITIDKKIRHEQDAASLPLAVLVLMAPTNRYDDLTPFAPSIEAALTTLVPRTLIEVHLSKVS